MAEPTRTMPPPRFALSIRQPWTWCIMRGGKRLENRSEQAIVAGGMDKMVGKRIALHASKGMGRDEYVEAARFIHSRCGVIVPRPADLLRGGIVGSVRIDNVVKESDDPWFIGPWALALSDPIPCDFAGASGALGIFEWFANGRNPDVPAPWMLKAPFLLPGMPGLGG